MSGGSRDSHGKRPIGARQSPNHIGSRGCENVVNRVGRGNNAFAARCSSAARQPTDNIAGFLVVESLVSKHRQPPVTQQRTGTRVKTDNCLGRVPMVLGSLLGAVVCNDVHCAGCQRWCVRGLH